MMVDLPLPEWPTNAITSPGLIYNDKSFRTATVGLDGYINFTLFISISPVIYWKK